MKEIPIVILKGCPYVEAPQCNLHVLRVLVRQLNLMRIKVTCFLRVCGQLFTLGGDGAGDAGMRDRAKCELRLSPAQWPS